MVPAGAPESTGLVLDCSALLRGVGYDRPGVSGLRHVECGESVSAQPQRVRGHEPGNLRCQERHLARTITAMAPNGIALQKIGQREAASDLAQAMGGWEAGLSGHPNIRGFRTAVLTPHTITSTTELWAFPDGAVKSVPAPTARPSQMWTGGGRRIDPRSGRYRGAVGQHLKSKLLTFRATRVSRSTGSNGRAAWAMPSRIAPLPSLSGCLPRGLACPGGVPMIPAGSFKDGAAAVTSNPLTGPGDGEPARPDKGDLVRFYNIGESVTSRLDAIRPDHAPCWPIRNSAMTGTQFPVRGTKAPPCQSIHTPRVPAMSTDSRWTGGPRAGGHMSAARCHRDQGQRRKG
jgi:hypothetical protein